jgi:hypothetical protein
MISYKRVNSGKKTAIASSNYKIWRSKQHYKIWHSKHTKIARSTAKQHKK